MKVNTNLQVELLFAKNEFYEVLRNRTLEHLYEENGKALGMKFTTEGFSGRAVIFPLSISSDLFDGNVFAFSSSSKHEKES